MSYKDKLQQAQKGNFENAPKLNVTYNIDVREHDKQQGVVTFSFWEKEEGAQEKHQVFMTKPITGVYLGAACIITAFSDSLGTKGGTYYSSIFFKNSDKIMLFKPGKDGRGEKVAFDNKGTTSVDAQAIKAWLVNNRCQPKVLRCIYVLTKSGLVKITTNITIAIDQLKKIEKELIDKQIVLTPTLYDPETPTISKEGKGYLSKLATKNPPKYAAITLGQDITEDIATAWRLDETVEEFLAWKEYKEKTGNPTDTDHGDPSVNKIADAHGNQGYINNGPRDLAAAQSASETDVPPVEDDLPF